MRIPQPHPLRMRRLDLLPNRLQLIVRRRAHSVPPRRLLKRSSRDGRDVCRPLSEPVDRRFDKDVARGEVVNIVEGSGRGGDEDCDEAWRGERGVRAVSGKESGVEERGEVVEDKGERHRG